ncbi:DUF1918 domain-containing protein [Nonomuraea spiralis]|uniref:DUF1918 domain-containing protein n=2 Tax=Streptosporangiaceae TaxID=2004 RepID=A0ABV5I743_9ACTN
MIAHPARSHRPRPAAASTPYEAVIGPPSPKLRPAGRNVSVIIFSPSEGEAKNRRSCDPAFSSALRRTNVEGMNATVGDRLLMHGNTVGERERSGVIIEVHGVNGGPPYIVRFDDGHTGLVFPGPDAVVVPQ